MAARKTQLTLELKPKELAKLREGALDQRLPVTQAGEEDQVSVYYDTKKRKLRRAGLSLRISQDDGNWAQFVASIEAGRPPAEWTQALDGASPDLDEALPGLPKKQRKRLAHKLRPLFETRTHRSHYDLAVGDTLIRLSLDRGSVAADGRTEPLCQLTLEQNDGPRSDLFRLARAIDATAPVQIAGFGVADRGHALSLGEVPRAVPALRIALKKKLDCASTFQIIARSCLTQLSRNRPLVIAGDAEALHQARVALRRLRAAISLFAPMLDDPQTDKVKAEVKWLGGELGRARELDVLAREVLTSPGDGGNFRAMVRAEREAAFTHVSALLEGRRFRWLALDAISWIEDGDWLRSEDKPKRRMRRRPILKQARIELRRRHAKILKGGRHLGKDAPQDRHLLRIRIKTLRYASEFFASLFAEHPKRRRRFIEHLVALQDHLGDLNDLEANALLKTQIGSDPTQNGNRALSADPQGTHEADRLHRLLRRAEKSFRAFGQAKPYWT